MFFGGLFSICNWVRVQLAYRGKRANETWVLEASGHILSIVDSFDSSFGGLQKNKPFGGVSMSKDCLLIHVKWVKHRERKWSYIGSLSFASGGCRWYPLSFRECLQWDLLKVGLRMHVTTWWCMLLVCMNAVRYVFDRKSQISLNGCLQKTPHDRVGLTSSSNYKVVPKELTFWYKN